MRVQWIYHVLVLSRGFVFGCENYEMEWTGRTRLLSRLSVRVERFSLVPSVGGTQ